MDTQAIKDFAQQNPKVAIGTGLIAIGLMMGSPEMSRQASHQAALGEAQWQVEQAADRAELMSETANLRYQNGCLLVRDESGTNYVNLASGVPVVDSASRISLPLGTEVCDVNGNTGVIKANPDTGIPQIVDMAKTSDQQVIDARLSNEVRSGGTQATPVIYVPPDSQAVEVSSYAQRQEKDPPH